MLRNETKDPKLGRGLLRVVRRTISMDGMKLRKGKPYNLNIWKRLSEVRALKLGNHLPRKAMQIPSPLAFIYLNWKRHQKLERNNPVLAGR